MSFTKGFRQCRHGRHLTGHQSGTGTSSHETDYPLALSRMRLLAGSMALVSVFEILLVVVVRKLVPDFRSEGIEIAKMVMAGAAGISALVFLLVRLERIPFKARFIIGVWYVIGMVVVISAAEVTTQWWVGGGQLNGLPWVCIWLMLVPLVVPIRWERALARAGTLSLLPAVVMFAEVRLLGFPPAPIEAYLSFILPCLIVTMLALIIAKVMYNLTREVQEARQLGNYELEERIGAGGMGEVWKARHRMLVRPAAVKLIRPESLVPGSASAGQNALVERFQREAQATASLRSPHTVELYDFGVSDDGTFFYVMELLSGLDLQALVERFGPLSPERVIYLMRQMCDSLADAHDAGLLHRDIKPANIFVCRAGRQRDFVKILDFGLVKSLNPKLKDADLTMLEAAVGTPSVMAPEVINGRQADRGVDLYGLGCVGYWLLTGSQVFTAESALALAAAHAKDAPAAPSTRSELPIPAELDRIILDCLAKDPNERPSDAEELADRLRACSIDAPWSQIRAKDWWGMHLGELETPRCPAE